MRAVIFGYFGTLTGSDKAGPAAKAILHFFIQLRKASIASSSNRKS